MKSTKNMKRLLHKESNNLIKWWISWEMTQPREKIKHKIIWENNQRISNKSIIPIKFSSKIWENMNKWLLKENTGGYFDDLEIYLNLIFIIKGIKSHYSCNRSWKIRKWEERYIVFGYLVRLSFQIVSQFEESLQSNKSFIWIVFVDKLNMVYSSYLLHLAKNNFEFFPLNL